VIHMEIRLTGTKYCIHPKMTIFSDLSPEKCRFALNTYKMTHVLCVSHKLKIANRGHYMQGCHAFKQIQSTALGTEQNMAF